MHITARVNVMNTGLQQRAKLKYFFNVLTTLFCFCIDVLSSSSGVIVSAFLELLSMGTGESIFLSSMVSFPENSCHMGLMYLVITLVLHKQKKS